MPWGALGAVEPAALLALQRAVGNCATAALVVRLGAEARRPVVQRAGPTVQRAKQEIEVEMIIDQLSLAVSDRDISVGDQGSHYVLTVNAAKVSYALQGLTHSDGQAVAAAWDRRNTGFGRLRDILVGKSGVRGIDDDPAMLPADKSDLVALLDGTVPETGPAGAAPSERSKDADSVAANARRVDAVHLHDLLYKAADREGIFAILARRGGPPSSPGRHAFLDEYNRLFSKAPDFSLLPDLDRRRPWPCWPARRRRRTPWSWSGSTPPTG